MVNPALSVSLIWLLAMLAAAAHMAAARPAPAGPALAVAAYMLLLWPACLVTPQPNWVGVLIGIAAFWRLIAGPMPRAGPLIAGACAALAAALQVAGGLDYRVAGALGLVALLGAGLAPARAPGGRVAFREHVLVVAALAAPAFGLAGDAAYGWRSATMLNRAAGPPHALAPPLWALAILALALAAGVIKGFWIRR
ncbi:hypothetical protein F9288_17335 [Sphingomonas sp. CL5.1]|uniref:hypothetical protein n=1 Tax=Sphingomonas sp. CL5.1 TaxID=2653203 RepID=UPI001583FEE2|nr:hypothetical protein [Sphingomonas sp. CL5.1]QKS01194.1 hypothetical protein F9288_17335 [Sphingomonas sp. CL5.1]